MQDVCFYQRMIIKYCAKEHETRRHLHAHDLNLASHRRINIIDEKFCDFAWLIKQAKGKNCICPCRFFNEGGNDSANSIFQMTARYK